MNDNSDREFQDTTANNRDSSRFWLWPLVALLLIIFGIGIGLAINSFTNRISSTPPSAESELATNVDAQETPEPVAAIANENADDGANPTESGTQAEDASASIDAAETGSVTPTTATDAASDVATEAPTLAPTLTATPLPACERSVVADFEELVDRGVLGCPTSDLFITWAAWQPFERGYLFWRSDRDSSYALFGQDAGRWTQLQLSGGTEPVDRGAAPAGLESPVRGFGYVWATDDNLYNEIGWATDKEKGFCVAMQGFENGLVLQSTPVDSCTPNGLFNQAQSADWQPVTIVSTSDGRWSINKTLPTADSPDVAAVPAPTLPVPTSPAAEEPANQALADPEQARPDSNGRFIASTAAEIVLDGNLGEWDESTWIEIGSAVWGDDERSGDADFSAQFQLRWSDSDLWFALRVTDDAYRSGPFGTNMWQGDGVEIHFDRELTADADSSEMDGDDYQIGVGFGPTLSEITAYRWIPFELEGSMPIAGAAQATAQGYNAEFRLPWSTFTVTDDLLRSGQRFGFNISINDNDASTPKQETTLSASPARTDHKTPTEWGILVLE